jgi:hypothetical protein
MKTGTGKSPTNEKPQREIELFAMTAKDHDELRHDPI